MGYRDDQKALRIRTEHLEEELEEARREIAELRGEGDRPAQLEQTGAAEEGSASGRSGVALGAVLMVMGLVLAVAVPSPPVLAVSTVVILLGGLAAGASMVQIARPNEALVLAGRKHKLADGSVSNFSMHVGGRVVRKPFLETVQTIDLRVMPIGVAVSKAYCEGGIPLDLTAEALVKVSSEPTRLRNATERFLGAPVAAIVLAAQQTLEGTLREQAAVLSLAELDGERMAANRRIAEAAEEDMEKLGLDLVGFWLMGIADADGKVEQRRTEELDETLRAAGLRREDPS